MVTIEKVLILNNRVEVLNDSSVISIVFSLGEGMNGDMIQRSTRQGRMMIAQCKQGILKLKIRSKEGNEKSMPDVNTNDLMHYQIRVNVTGAGGFGKAFRIINYETAEEDNGPLLDMFGGRLPLSKGDYAITTETKSVPKPTGLKGKVGYLRKDNWMLVPITLPDGKTHQFVLDLAATSTVINQSILPTGTDIRKMEMVEYQADKKMVKDANLQGGTGSVSSDKFLGKALLKTCKLGEIKIEEINASVLTVFPPKLTKMGISGVLGTDVLRRTSSIVISGLRNDKGGEIELGGAIPVTKSSTSYPFLIAAGLFFVEGKIGNAPIQFVIDTGARTTVLSSSFANEHKLSFVVLAEEEMTGIDGQSVKAKVVSVPECWVGASKFVNRHMTLTDVAALQAFGLQNGSALLGMDFFATFSSVAFDMMEQRMILTHQ